jgi:outer membrane protein
MNRSTGVVAALLCMPALHAYAQQSPPVLTLKEAQQTALANRPLLRASQLSADSARQITLQIQSGRYPQVLGSVTAATATTQTTVQDGKEVTLDTRIAAGFLNNPSVLWRAAAGLGVSQLITDFGRTSSLVQSAQSNESAQRYRVSATRAQVLLEVGDAYLAALEAQAVRRVAAKTVDARKALLDRIAALAKSKLRSELDVRFAQVNLDQARLLLLSAENAVDAAFARLSTSLGYRDARRFTLVDQPDSSPPPMDLDSLLAQAIAKRPELASLRADRDAAKKFVDAQKALRYPIINVYGAAGVVPVGDDRFPQYYGAIGINLNVPVFDGGKISALQQQAQLQALTLSENVTETENNVVKAVRVAWLNAKAGYENIEITAHLQEASAQALSLAESRYNLGITSIVELNQAQLSAIDAEIVYSQARYRYLSALTALDYQVGTLEPSDTAK